MTTEQEDAAMLLELQEKITRRIREQIRLMIDGVYDSGNGPVPTYPDYGLEPGTMRNSLFAHVATILLNDPSFITELTRKIGQKMATAH